MLYDNKPPFPVVDVNDLWLQQCGFQREEVTGKTMWLIQGPLTEGEEVGRLMDTIYLATMPPAGSDRSPKSFILPLIFHCLGCCMFSRLLRSVS